MNIDVTFSGTYILQFLLFYKIYSVMTSFSQVELLLLPKKLKDNFVKPSEWLFSNNFCYDIYITIIKLLSKLIFFKLQQFLFYKSICVCNVCKKKLSRIFA